MLWIALRIFVTVAVGQLQRLAGAVGVGQTIHDLGVEDEVLAAGAVGHRVHPAGRVDLAGAGLGRSRTGASSRAGRRGCGRGGRCARRLRGPASRRRCRSAAASSSTSAPSRRHRGGSSRRCSSQCVSASCCMLVGERPVGVVVVGGGLGRGGQDQRRGGRGEEGAEHWGRPCVGVLGRSHNVPGRPTYAPRGIGGGAAHPEVEPTSTLGERTLSGAGPYASGRARFTARRSRRHPAGPQGAHRGGAPGHAVPRLPRRGQPAGDRRPRPDGRAGDGRAGARPTTSCSTGTPRSRACTRRSSGSATTGPSSTTASRTTAPTSTASGSRRASGCTTAT